MRIMVEQSETPGAGGNSVIDGPLGRRVAPTQLLRILLDRILSVVDHQVGVGEELDMASVLTVHEGLPGEPGRWIRCVRLVIGRVHDHHTAGLQTVAERESGMVQILRDDAHTADHEAIFDEVVKARCGPELRERNGKVVVLHLSGQDPFQLLSDRTRSVDVPYIARHEERREEREALDVIPVGVRDQQMAVARGLAPGHQRVSQLVSAGPTVKDQEGPIDASDLYARRVAAIAERGGARLGYGTTGAPEPDLHHVSLRPSDRHLLGRQLRDLLTTRGRTPKRSIAESAPQRT